MMENYVMVGILVKDQATMISVEMALFLRDRTNTPKMQEVKYCYQYVDFRIDENDIHINNNYLFTDLNEYQLQMDLLCNGNVVQSKTMTVDCQPLSSVVVENSFKINNQNQEYAVNSLFEKK